MTLKCLITFSLPEKMKIIFIKYKFLTSYQSEGVNLDDAIFV